MRRSICFFIISLLIFATLFSSSAILVNADGNVKDIRLHINGPDVLGIDRNGHYAITLIDTQERNWNYTVFVTAENTTGAQPLENSPKTGNLTSGNKTFNFDITAISEPGEMTIVINISSPSGLLWYTTERDVTIVTPIELKVTIFNTGEVKINNATVDFLVDNEVIGVQTLTTLDPGSSTDLSAEWVSEDFYPGWHTSKVVVDVNDDGVIDPSIGDIVVTSRFYIEGGTTSVLLLFMLGFIAIIIGVYIISKKMKGR